MVSLCKCQNINNTVIAEVRIDDAVLYPNPYMTITSKNYTKHYYAGSERIATVIGGGGLDSMVYSTSVTPTQEELTVKAGFLNHYLHHQDPFLYDGVVDTVIPTEDIRGVYDPYLQYGCPSVILDTIAMKIYPDILLDNITYYGRFRDNEMSSVYFTHSDHLGSTSWITNCMGTPYQYLHYAPYGEMIANQTPYGYDERFKFIDKERDEESGYDYFGERYFYSTFNHWLSVDPMSDKYPHISPYAYCGWNPIGFIDPDGEEWLTDEDAQQASKYTQAMENKITQLSKQMARAKSEEKQTTLSQRISSLRAGINELNEMGEMPDVKFTYNNLSETVEEGYTEFLDENTIVMAVPQGSIALGIHESSHGYDYAKQRGVYYEYEKIPGEIKAYQRQFSFSPSSLPPSLHQNYPHNFHHISPSWVFNIYTMKNGDLFFPYR